MVTVAIIQNVQQEGPGALGTFLEEAGCHLEVVRLYDGDLLPEEPGRYDGLVVLGGPMNVYEYHTYPYLEHEARFLVAALADRVPALGICLGAQMIAIAAGAQVELSAAREVGWSSVELTEAGLTDQFFASLPRRFDVFQWHEDVFGIPRGGSLLATGTICRNQAFRFGSAIGLQFHVEVTRDLLGLWFEGSSLRDEIMQGYERLGENLGRRAKILFTNFLEEMGRQRR